MHFFVSYYPKGNQGRQNDQERGEETALHGLNEKGVMRYSEIQRRVPQATAKMLSQQLREMEADGIISRKVYPVVPPKTEYALTDLGKATVPIVHAMDKWGADFFTRLGVPIPCDEEE